MKPYELNIRQGRAYWQEDILWVVLAEGKDTNNSFSLMWELCPAGSGPPPHYHDQDEGFYVVDGQVTYTAGEQRIVATSGSFIWIPRGTVHGFRVDTPTATLLNLYTPAGFEQAIIQNGRPAEHFDLPEKGVHGVLDMPAIMALFQQIGMHAVQAPDVLRPAAPAAH